MTSESLVSARVETRETARSVNTRCEVITALSMDFVIHLVIARGGAPRPYYLAIRYHNNPNIVLAMQWAARDIFSLSKRPIIFFIHVNQNIIKIRCVKCSLHVRKTSRVFGSDRLIRDFIRDYLSRQLKGTDNRIQC